MKNTSVLYQLFLDRVNSYSAIALSLCLTLAATPAMAQNNTIELQDAGSNEATTEKQGINYRDLPPLENNNSSQPDLPPALPAESIEFATGESDYTLGAGDKINLNIFQVEEYSGDYPVLVDGTISLPLVGRVDVRGLSLKETSDKVSKEYSTYLKRPIITVGLIAPRPLKIGVSGEVDNPGSYEVALEADNPQFPSVTDIIQQAGGITTIADVRNVRVRRQVKGKEVVYNSNLWNLLTKGKVREDISLRDGDDIFIPTTDEINTSELNRLAQASFGLQSDKPIQVAVVGEVYRPGSHFIQPELLSRGNENGANQGRQESIPPRLSQALVGANGIKPLADVRDVQVKRTSWDGSEKLIKVDLWELITAGDTDQDIILQDGDKIVIAKADKITSADSQTIAAGTISPGEISVNVVGEVVNPGPVNVQPNTPLNQAILAAGGFDSQRANSKEVELVSLKPNGTVEKRKIKVDLGAEVNDETNPVLNRNDVVVVGRSGSTKTFDGVGKVTSPLGGLFGLFNAIF
ncbi:SLBB domain-containing protein [Waterburya agarophytonicola K14]|uniref:SLBB domain-containing protein n=1 Tax=Waterburya agarophytonicola KI4 TaxID=2874699 RepID=A0A964BTE1_9CYAN|nr:polysaccharide biosynthesis/export family protein [Waterburya agarophytonicola]MCC0178372.1 SLBB domain-containing protein [Waterburya agarophytonicola KI4]